MNLTLNTFGLRSINAKTFNASSPDKSGVYSEHMPIHTRDLVITFLRINNLFLNALGYIPKTRHISGCVRIGTGLSITLLALAVGTPSEGSGIIVGRWYSEALLTGIAQVARGAITAFCPLANQINVALDCIGSLYNFHVTFRDCSIYLSKDSDEISAIYAERRKHAPYADPTHPIPLQLLYLG